MLLNFLLKHCAKHRIFHKFVDVDTLISTLRAFLEMPGSTIRLLSLLCICYFIDETNPKETLVEHFQVLSDDVSALKIDIERKLVSAVDGLCFLRTASKLHQNLDTLQQCDVPEYVSHFLDNLGEESTFAAEILTHLLSDGGHDDSSLTINEKVERATTVLLSDSVSNILSSLRSVLKTLESDMKNSLQELSQEDLDSITTNLCLYMKLHSQGKLKSLS